MRRKFDSCSRKSTSSGTDTSWTFFAANNSILEMNEFIGSDSLEFITLENLRRAIQLDGECCDACLTGSYPAPTPVVLGTAGSRW